MEFGGFGEFLKGIFTRKSPDAALSKVLFDEARIRIESLEIALRDRDHRLKEFEIRLNRTQMPDEECERKLAILQREFEQLTIEYIHVYRIMESIKKDYESLKKINN